VRDEFYCYRVASITFAFISRQITTCSISLLHQKIFPGCNLSALSYLSYLGAWAADKRFARLKLKRCRLVWLSKKLGLLWFVESWQRIGKKLSKRYTMTRQWDEDKISKGAVQRKWRGVCIFILSAPPGKENVDLNLWCVL